MRVLIVEDNPEKYYDVKFALSQLGIADLTLVENANDATLTVLEQKENETPYDLIISDMQFPLFSSGKPVDDAGMTFIDEIHNLGVTTPIIICSSFRLQERSVLGCVHYSPKTDLVVEFKRLLEQIK